MNRFFENKRLPFLSILALSLIYFFGLGQFHLFDWDEINFAECAREMIESGNYLNVQIDFLPFWEKPPLFMWWQVLSMKIFGINEYAARFPNAVFGVLTLLTLFKIGERLKGIKFGFIWSLLYFGSLLPHFYFKSGIIDPSFNLLIFLSIYFLLRNRSEDSGKLKWALLAGLCSGLAVLTKGPVGFLLLFLTFGVFLIFTRFKNFPKIKDLGVFFGALGFIIICWLGVNYYFNGLDLLIQFIEYQIELFTKPVAGHEQPFYYHFVVVFIGCFPLSVFALGRLFKKEESESNFALWMKCLFWVVMILFSITTTKIVHYSSMAYLPLSYFAASYVFGVINDPTSRKKFVNVLFIIVGTILTLLFSLLPVIAANNELLEVLFAKDKFGKASFGQRLNWTGFEFLIGIFFFITMVLSTIWLLKKHFLKSVLSVCLGLGFTLLLYQFFMLPNIEGYTQRPALKFYEEHEGEDVYIFPHGYKSYANLFYFKQPNSGDQNRRDSNWLIDGDIDKPVYFVKRVDRGGLDDKEDIKFLYQEGGFRFYQRLPKQ